MAVIEVTYEKFIEFNEKEVEWIYKWIQLNFNKKISQIF